MSFLSLLRLLYAQIHPYRLARRKWIRFPLPVRRIALYRLPDDASPSTERRELPPAMPSAVMPLSQGQLPERFQTATFRHRAGERDYKLYIPSTFHGQLMPLIVMLHGCRQTPDDFAHATRMNVLAEEFGFLVLYPAQSVQANARRCWNWFRSIHQLRDTGEPSIIADLTREIAKRFSADEARIFVAGLSAGGSMAAIMAEAYPDLYAAAAVHSGTPYQSAHSASTALYAMRKGPARCFGERKFPPNHSFRVPVMVFHGDCDATVHPSNGQSISSMPHGSTVTIATTGQRPGRLGFTVTTCRDEAGVTLSEVWLIHGCGHAWSGGSSEGTYVEERGPDASREMVRFFLERGRRPHSGYSRNDGATA